MRILIIAAAALALYAQQPAGGERQESLKGVKPKGLAPVSKDILRVSLPRPVDRKLKNGLPVMVMENRRVPTVAIDLVIPASNLNDPADLPGAAEATASLLREGGAGKRTSREIAEALAEMGASLNAYTSYGSRTTHVTASCLVEDLDAVLQIFADVLQRPAFAADEVTKWKARRASSLQQMRTSPQFLGDERLRQILYPGDARAVGAPTPESLKRLTPGDLVKFHKTFYRPGESLLGVTGDVSADAIAAKLEKQIGSWESGAAAAPKLPMREPIGEKNIYVVHRPNSVQTYLLLANRAIDRLSPDYIASMVMNRVLGGGPAARLFRNIREEKGYTYGVGSGFTALKYMNHFSASSSVRTEVTAPALDEFLSEFRAIREKPVPAEELEGAKRAIVANFALSLESQSGMLSQRMLLREYGLPEDYWDTYPVKVMAVTAEDVQRVARKYVPLDNLQLVAVGDAEKIAAVLAKYGPVERYDAEGKKVP